jgi:hypothetical protein
MATASREIARADLAQMAASINAAHRAALAAVRSGIEHAHRAGALLLRAKKECGHGEWIPWLEEHCAGLGVRQAQRYMRLAANWKKLPASKESEPSHLTIDGALAMLADPRPAPETDEVCDQLEVACNLLRGASEMDMSRLSLEELQHVVALANECIDHGHAVKIDAMTGLGGCVNSEQAKK